MKHALNHRQGLQRIGDYSYSLSDALGQGSFSTVYLGRSLITGEKVAVKVVNLKGAQQNEVIKNVKN
jgi:serine/threonine protein kinase